MEEKDLNNRAAEMGKMIAQTAQADEQMKHLQNDLHKIISERVFEIFPFLPDAMEPNEIRYLGERISRHLYSLSEELKNFAFTMEAK